MNHVALLACRQPVASARSRQLLTWVLASRFLIAWVCLACGLAAVASMTELTSMPGLMTISTEGGPERRLYGP